MSTTSTITMPAAHDAAHHTSCPSCGVEIPLNDETVPLAAQQQIEELQAQVRLLTEKATAAG